MSNDLSGAMPDSDGREGQILRIPPESLRSLAQILESNGYNPGDAADGWRSRNPLIPALLYAANGYPQFPCTIQKTPLIRNGVNGATCDLRTILYWARDLPLAGFCIRTGRYQSSALGGLWIFDKDDAAGYIRWGGLVSDLGTPPPTWTLMSGREGGGEHVCYAPASYGPDMKTVRHALINGTRGKIDQKGRGGYAVGPGSLHKTGNRYYWKPGHAPDEIPLATLPPAWVAAMDKADEPPGGFSAAPRVWSPRSKLARNARDGGTRNDVFGDGPEGGGFHGPINNFAIRFFRMVSPDASREPLIKTLRKLIEAAPKGPGRDVSRYLSAQYLEDAVESARKYVRNERYVE